MKHFAVALCLLAAGCAAPPPATTRSFADNREFALVEPMIYEIGASGVPIEVPAGKPLAIRPGMTEDEVLSIAGKPDSQADQGGPSIYSDRVMPATRTYTYLPSKDDPYVTTVTFAGGRVTDVRREKKS